MNKEVRSLIRDLKRVPGVAVGRGPHYKVTYNSAFVVSLPGTPSDPRWKKNAMAAIRRSGIDLTATVTRPHNGATPPPLPEIKEASVPEPTVSESLTAQAEKTANRVAKAVESHYNLTPRRGRLVGHGMTPSLAPIIEAYATAKGLEIPHREYTRHYDVNNKTQMARLAAMRVGDMASHARGGVNRPGSVATRTTTKIIEFAWLAWTWFEDHDYTFPKLPQPEIPVTGYTQPESEPVQEEDRDVPVVGVILPDLAPTNGKVADETLDSLFEAIAVMGKHDTHAAKRLGKQLYEALGR